MTPWVISASLIVFSMLLYLGVVLNAKKGLSVLGFAVNNRNTSAFSLTTSILASLVGGWMFLGLTAIGYEAGVAGLAIGFGYVLGLLILYCLTPKIWCVLEETGAYTLDSFLGNRYGGAVHGLIITLNFVFFIAVLAGQFVAFSSTVGLFLDGNGLFFSAILAAVVVSYTAISGYQGVLVTDKLQLIFIGLALVILLWIILGESVDVDALMLPVEYYNGTGMGIIFLFGTLFFFPFTMIARTDLWQRFASANSMMDIRRSILTVAAVLLPIYCAIIYLAYSVRISGFVPTNSETSVLELFSSIIDGSPYVTVLSGVVFIGFIAALVSTIDTNLNVVSIAISQFLLKSKAVADQSDEGVPKQYRFVTVIVGALGFCVSVISPSIIDLVAGAASILLVMLPQTIYALFATHNFSDKRFNYSVFASLLLAFVILLVFFIFISPTTAFLPSFAVSLVGMSVSVWFFGPNSESKS